VTQVAGLLEKGRKGQKIASIVMGMTLLLFWVDAGDVRAYDKDPWHFNDQDRVGCDEAATQGKHPQAGRRGGALQKVLRGIFQAVSAVDGDRCPMTPTCSTYSLQAMARHGFVLGWLMTVDRLIRETDEQRYCPWVLIDGAWHCLDPVDANEAWWASSGSGRLDK